MEPVKLTIKDFYSIAEGEIDFTKFSSALIVGEYENNPLMANGSGKSAALESIRWALFNDTRHKAKDDVIRWTTNETCVEFEFLFDRRHYKVVRRRSRISKESAVSLFVKSGDKWLNDSATIATDTNKKITDLLKIDAEIFLNSVYFKQHDISLFANSSPGDRKEIIKSIMKMDHWDEYQKVAKDNHKLAKDDVERLERVVEERIKLPAQEKINAAAIERLNDEIEQVSRQHRITQDNLYSLLQMKKERNVGTLLQRKNDLENKIIELKSQGKKQQTIQNDMVVMIELHNEQCRRYAQKIMSAETELGKIADHNDELNDKPSNYKELEKEILDLKIAIGSSTTSLNDLLSVSDLLGLGQCQICLTDINESNLGHIHNNRQLQVKTLEETIERLNNKLSVIEKEFAMRSKVAAMLEANALRIKENTEIKTMASQKKQELERDTLKLTNESAIITTTLLSLVDTIKSNKIDIEALETQIAEQRANNIDDQIVAAESKYNVLANLINAKNMELGTLMKERDFINDGIGILKVANETLDIKRKERLAYEALIRHYGKDGIQAVFIEQVVDELEYYTNQTLSQICNEPTVIKLRTQKRTKDAWQETLEIDVMINGYPQTFESLSGGEGFRVSLALRIGLSEVLVKRSGGEIKMLLLDEIDSPLDTFGLNNLFGNIIKGLEKRFKIVVISHNNMIREKFDNVINIVKTSKGSFIQPSN